MERKNKIKVQQQNKHANIIFLSEPRIEPGNSRTAVWRVISRSSRLIDESIVVKIVNCLNVMGRNTFVDQVFI